MTSFTDHLKLSFLKGIEALGKGASSLAEGAQQKLSEISLETRRHEILTKIPDCVQELFAQGVSLPDELTSLLSELSELDAKLAEMRAARKVPDEQEAQEEPEAPAEEAGEPVEEPEAAEEEAAEEETAEVSFAEENAETAQE